MYNIDKKFASILISCVLLGGSGCDPELAPEGVAAEAAIHHEIEDLARAGEASLRVDELDVEPMAEAVTVRVGRLSDGSFGVLEGAKGRAIAPGVWEVEAEDGLVQQVVVGDEGHGWLIGQMTAQLDELRSKLETEVGHEDALLEQILAVEQAIAGMESAPTDLAQSGGATLAPSCSIGLYAGPSGPVWGVVGATAFAQSSCSGGCAKITVSSQACCNGACTPYSIATNTVCAPLWTSGMIRQGAGAGAAQVSVTPVTVTNQGFSCS